MPIAADTYPPGSIDRAVATLGGLDGLAAFRYTLRMYRDSTRAFLADAPARIAGWLRPFRRRETFTTGC